MRIVRRLARKAGINKPVGPHPAAPCLRRRRETIGRITHRPRWKAGWMLMCMHSTSVRIDVATHQELKRLAAELHTTVGNTVSLAVRALRQDRVGTELTEPLREDETAWLDADLG